MPLTLELTNSPGVPLEVEGLTPRAAAEFSSQDLRKFPVQHGNRKAALGDFFSISGSVNDLELRFVGDLSGVHWIGAGMDEGRVFVEENAGRHVGSEMTGGQIEVRGDVGDWLGGEMHGGEILVHKNAGHLVGAAYRGSRCGMTGGTIIVRGAAGNEIGQAMRRGTIAIGGRSGDMPGFNMLAGSIYLLGECGIRPGGSMKRGTIAYLGSHAPELLPTFRRAGTDRPDFLQLVFRDLAARGLAIDDELANARFTLYHGDLVELGRGEILVRET
ncbi:MAG: formylmethanofuran dehydrogenase subunit C [Pirellulales bacterium]|nr:formylmethanofuran dehydrogenase subunit C [Pirellulales bacterium]